MGLADINELFIEKEREVNNRDKELATLLNVYVDSTSVQHTPENGYINNRKIASVDRFQLVKMLQDKVYEMIQRDNTLVSNPKEIINTLCKEGISIKLFQVCLELSLKDIEDLKAGFKFPYLMQAWNSVFGDLERKVLERKKENVEDLTQSTVFYTKCIPLKELQDIYNLANRDFKEPEDILKYMVDSGIPVNALARIIHTAESVMIAILSDLKLLNKDGIQRVNYIFKENFQYRD